MERRRDTRYKQNMEPPSHHYNDRYGSQYDNYDYEEDYGNQYANSDPHMHHRGGHHLHHHSHEEEEEHWASQNSRDQQQDFYDTVPATNVLPLPIKTNPKSAINIARVQIAAGDRDRERERERERERDRDRDRDRDRERERESDNSSSSIPQAPPPPRFGPTDRYGNDTKSKYGNSSMAMGISSEKQADVHIRFEPTGKREFQHQHKPTSFIDGFRSGDVPVMTKKKENGGGGQTANAIRSIINNLKGGNESKNESDSIPRNRVSTNPFVRANQQMQMQAQNQQNPNHNQSRFEMSQPKNPSKNVAEVVEKMNSGDWPIRIDDDETAQTHQNQKNSAAIAERRSFSSQHMEKEKAKQWETLHRKKDEKRSILEDKPDFQMVQNHPQNQSIGQNQNMIQKQQQQQQQIREENDKMSDKSHEEENTTVSTDSALCSEETRGISPYKLPFDGTRPIDDEQLTEESEKLLFYFKSHREVLNYLGIGLSERLWKHMDNLPSFDASIKIFKSQNSNQQAENEVQKPGGNLKVPQSQPPNIPQPPKISITPSFQQDRKSPINRDMLHQHQQQQQLRSPVRTGSQNEERTPLQIPSQDDSRYLKNNEYFQNSSNRDRMLNSSGGRFVKKSAAALIAKKQGMAIEDPNSATEIIDPRIAEEIRNLRDREEELKRSRSETAISTSPIPSDETINMNSTKQSIRNAQSYEQLLDNPRPHGRTRSNVGESHRSPIERSHSSHNIYIENDCQLPRHNTHSFSDMNYGSMPRAHTHSRQENQYGHTNNYRAQQDGGGDGYRHPRKNEFFRIPSNSEAAHATRSKSITSFETKPPSFHRSGLQLPAASVSVSSSSRTPDKFNNSKSVYGKVNAHPKIGL